MPQASGPLSGGHNPYPTAFKNLHVGLRGRMLPHIHVHRRSNNDRRVGGQKQGGEEIVGQAVGELRQDVGGRRRNDQGFGRLGFANVLDGGVEIALSLPGDEGHRPVITLWPVSEAKVSGVMNFWAASVITTWTSSAWRCKARTNSAAL